MRELLNKLADGQFHGGNELGEALNVSRAAIWKQIQKLMALGVDIQSVRGKGYRLAHPLEWLEPSQIHSVLPTGSQSLLSRLAIHEQVDSTNGWVLEEAAKGAVRGLVCLAEQQTKGRGRRGRTWVSPMACNLYLSVLWEFDQGAAQLEGLSLAAGVAVARALEKLQVPGIGLKWPNDVMANGAKLGGILLEISGDLSGRCQVVLGVGLNHLMSRSAAGAIDQDWARVHDLQPGIGRNQLAGSVVGELLLMLAEFSHSGFAPYVQAWQALDIYAGEPVQVISGQDILEGVAQGIDATGGLRLEMQGETRILTGGEISLRPSI